MPCTVTAFSVKIASPGDAGIELTIALDVIREWNARQALTENRILLPLDGEEAADFGPVDMIVAFFCGKTGTPSSFEAEIEKLLQGGKPALVYFSEGRSDLIGAQVSPGPILEDFKKRFAAATVDSYGDEKELRATFARQLDATISSHAHFQVGGSVSCSSSVAVPEAPAEPLAESTGALSSCATTILMEACDDFEAYIGRMKIGTMLRIQANGKQLVEPQTPESIAQWDGAFHELLTGGFIVDAGCNGQLFQISTKGFAFLKSIGKTPVGYIAEMGGM